MVLSMHVCNCSTSILYSLEYSFYNVNEDNSGYYNVHTSMAGLGKFFLHRAGPEPVQEYTGRLAGEKQKLENFIKFS